MSVTFLRPGEEEGIEMPIREAISKSMICMMFDLDEKAYLYILKEDGSIASTMLGIESTFTPTEPGKYCVKTDAEVDNAETVGVNDLEKTWKSIKKYQKETFKRLPAEMIIKIFNEMDYQTFARLAQTCEWMQEILETQGHRLEVKAPLRLTVVVGPSGVAVISETVIDKADKQTKPAKFKIRIANLNVLKPFRVQRIIVDTSRLDLSPKYIGGVCSLLINCGVTTDKLVLNGVSPSRSVFLTAALKPKTMHFVGNTGWGSIETWTTKTITPEAKEKADLFIPEEFPNLDYLAIADSKDMENCFQTDLFMQAVRKSAVVCFRPFKNYSSMSHLLMTVFQQYLTSNDRGLNRIVTIYIDDNSSWSEMVEAILEGRKYEKMKSPVNITGEACSTARIYHTEYGVSTEFFVQFTRVAQLLTLSFGVASNDFWKYMEMAYKEQ